MLYYLLVARDVGMSARRPLSCSRKKYPNGPKDVFNPELLKTVRQTVEWGKAKTFLINGQC